MVCQVSHGAVEPVGNRRARRAAGRVLGPEHEVIDEQLRASGEELSERRRAVIRLEAVLLVDSNPGQFLPPPRQLIAPPSKILLGLEQFFPDRNPFLSRNDLGFSVPRTVFIFGIIPGESAVDSQILSDCEAGIKLVLAKRHYQHARRSF